MTNRKKNKPIRTNAENKARRAARAANPKQPRQVSASQTAHASSNRARKKARDGEQKMRDAREAEHE